MEYLKFVQILNIEFIDSLKNSGTKYFPTFHNYCEKTGNSEAFVDSASWTTSWVEFSLDSAHLVSSKMFLSWLWAPKLAHCSLQNSRDVVQDTTLSTHVGLGPEINGWWILRCKICSLRLFIEWPVGHEQTIGYVIVQMMDPFPQIYLSPTGWNI